MTGADLFDTNILVDSLNGFEVARRELKRTKHGAVSVVTWMEVLAGASDADEAIMRALLAEFERIDLSDEIVERSALIRRTTRLKLLDAIILATAQSSGRVLVTRNTRDFPETTPGIRIPYLL